MPPKPAPRARPAAARPAKGKAGSHRTPQGVDIDAWLVSKRTLTLGAVGLIAFLGFAAWVLFGPRGGGDPESQARREIAEAQDLLTRAATSPNLTKSRNAFDEGKSLLDAARTAFDQKAYSDAIDQSGAAQRKFKSVINESAAEGDGSFREVEGSVEVQRGGSGTFEDARERMPLFDGDFVKTGADGSAEILYSNGDIHRVDKDTLFEFKRRKSAAGGPTKSEIKMERGVINIVSGGEETTITTPLNSTIRIDKDTRGRVEIDPADNTGGVEIYRGSGAVTTAAGQKVELREKQAVAETVDKSLGPVQLLPDPPTLTQPNDGQIFELRKTRQVTVTWQPVPGAKNYVLQISRGRFFVVVDVETERATTSAKLTIVSEGTFFWRVLAVSGEGARSEFSATRKFRFRSGQENEENLPPGGTPAPTAKPPMLKVNATSPIGATLLLRGQTDPGAVVTVNGEVASVTEDGNWSIVYQLKDLGVNVLTIKATRGGAETVTTHHFNYVEEN